MRANEEKKNPFQEPFFWKALLLIRITQNGRRAGPRRGSPKLDLPFKSQQSELGIGIQVGTFREAGIIRSIPQGHARSYAACHLRRPRPGPPDKVDGAATRPKKPRGITIDTAKLEGHSVSASHSVRRHDDTRAHTRQCANRKAICGSNNTNSTRPPLRVADSHHLVCQSRFAVVKFVGPGELEWAAYFPSAPRTRCST